MQDSRREDERPHRIAGTAPPRGRVRPTGGPARDVQSARFLHPGEGRLHVHVDHVASGRRGEHVAKRCRGRTPDCCRERRGVRQRASDATPTGAPDTRRLGPVSEMQHRGRRPRAHSARRRRMDAAAAHARVVASAARGAIATASVSHPRGSGHGPPRTSETAPAAVTSTRARAPVRRAAPSTAAAPATERSSAPVVTSRATRATPADRAPRS